MGNGKLVGQQSKRCPIFAAKTAPRERRGESVAGRAPDYEAEGFTKEGLDMARKKRLGKLVKECELCMQIRRREGLGTSDAALGKGALGLN